MFSFKNLIFVAVLVMLFASVILQLYTMYCMASATPYDIDSNTNVVTTAGLDAAKFWTLNKVVIIAPSAVNVIGMALLGILFVMG